MKYRKFINQLLLIFLGNGISSMGFVCFVISNHMLSGGVYGIVGLIQIFLPKLPFSILLLIINIPFFILAWLELSRRMVFLTGLAMLLQTIYIELFSQFLPTYTNDILLACIVGGVLIGLGGGITLRANCCGGGIDILSMVMRKRYNISIGTFSTAINFVIIGILACFKGLEIAMYTGVSIFVGGVVVNQVLDGITRKRTAMIITSDGEALGQELTYTLERGVTVLPAYGSYTGEKKDVLFCVVNTLEIARVKEIVAEIDPKAFMTITETAEVGGKFQKHHHIIDT